MMEDEKYYCYLSRRTKLGFIYRSYWLYPRLVKNIKGRTLDVGCGIGDFLRYRANTIGVDINPLTVTHCQKQGLEAHLMSSGVLPFEADSFDSVVLDNVLEHLESPEILLKEVGRVLCSNGTLLVGVPGKQGYKMDKDHKIFYDDSLLIRTVVDAKFNLKNIFHMPFRSRWLDINMSQYCIYGVFERE